MIQKNFLAHDFYLNRFFFFSFFYSIKKILLILFTQTRQFRTLFCCGRIVFVEDLVFEGESSPSSCVDF